MQACSFQREPELCALLATLERFVEFGLEGDEYGLHADLFVDKYC